MASKDFRSYKDALRYKNIMIKKGYKAFIEEFRDFDGVFYSVLVWKAAQ